MANQYEIPVFGTPGNKLHPWLLEAVADGEIWLKSQKPTQEWDTMREVLGPLYGNGPAALVAQSNVGYNLVRHLFKENRAALSDFRHAGEFVPTEDDSQQLYDRAHMLTALDRHWERVTFPNLVLRDAIGFALGFGTGYLYQDWDSSFWGPNQGDIRLRAYAPNEVTFVQMPRSHNLQLAYMVIIRDTLPINLAKRMYAQNPSFANALVPDGDDSSWIQKGLDRVQQFISPLLRASGTLKKNIQSSPTVDIFTAYTLDMSINPHAQPVKMGAVGTNWSYTVPFLGQELPQSVINPNTQQPYTIAAQPNDCMMFPLRRKTIFSRTGVGYDGSSPWWHGDVPLARIRFNDLPWETLGASNYGDEKIAQDGIINTLRAVEDSIAARLDPPAEYDERQVDKAWAEGFNPRKAGVRAAVDFSNEDPIRYPFPPQYYDVPAWIIGQGGYVAQREEMMQTTTGAKDLTAVAKARQIPTADTVEKLIEMSGPLVKDMVGGLVHPLTQLGEWRKSYYFQFYTKARMIRIADPEARELLSEVEYKSDKMTDVRTNPEALAGYKFTPDKIIPSGAPGEQLAQKQDRAKSYLSDFRYDVTESGISEITRMSRQLLYIQLSKSNVLPISWWTMAKIARVPNYGPPPAGTNTEMERVIAQKNIEAEMQIELAQKLQEAQMPPEMPGGPGAPAGGAPGGGQVGRPPSFSKAPHLENKDGGTRTTISTS